MIELLIVVGIVMVLMSIALPSLGRTQRAGAQTEIRAAAARYADAIDRYQADNGRVPPVFGSANWPNTSKAEAAKGPVSSFRGMTSRRDKYYLRSNIPEVMTRTGRISGTLYAATSSAAAESAAPRAGGGVAYIRAPYEYRIEVYWDGKLRCSLGATTAQHC